MLLIHMCLVCEGLLGHTVTMEAGFQTGMT